MSTQQQHQKSIPTEMRAAQILEQGDIGVIEVRQVKVPTPGPGQVLVRVEYAGNNFIDTLSAALHARPDGAGRS